MIRLEKFERAVSNLSTGGEQLGASAYELHSELTSALPQNSYKDDVSNLSQRGYSETTRGYSFIQVDLEGNRYHPLCYDIADPDEPKEPKVVWDGSTPVAKPIKNEKRVKNKNIIDKYGGQSRSGITTPSKHPVIFLITSDKGEEFGYTDGWTDNGSFEICGEGQVGDMQYVRGNKAILEHRQNVNLSKKFNN